MDDKSQFPSSQFERMDRMYRHQRFFYDLTRKYYLLGRDRLIAEMKIEPGDRVLELGCGTARNLIALAKKHPESHFYGLDASAEMLRTAQKKIDAAGLSNITLRTALADEFSFDGTFGLDDRFDNCFFSYAVSIIPPWRESIRNAIENLKPEGKLHIVDFFDQNDLPAWFRTLLQGWLEKFHVRYPEELIPFLETLRDEGSIEFRVDPLYRRYALIVEVTKAQIQ
ncbi:MAG: class I SAM-dependent methyltransferase [Acidobacteria bacterium]|nr:class I SAM-dependent methyltransferase [Acidobacteriota bacterium]